MILKRMKRRHSRKDAIAFCQKARALRPDVVFGADLIAGFPTETDDMFENTLRSIDECDLTYLHVFPYSPRPGTPASRMPPVPGAVVKERAARLRQKGEEALRRFYQSWIGQDVHFLVESVENTHEGMTLHGKTDHFAPIHLETSLEFAVGSIVKAHIVDATADGLKGKKING
jgi:threonylcarbamoyladenosine tRNA methylthiotransferase MtaB